MPPNPQNRTFSNPIPPTSVESVVEAISHEAGRVKIKAIFEECTGAVVFEELVMKYAGKEIERRSLGTYRFWLTTIAVALVTGVIGSLITLAITSQK